MQLRTIQSTPTKRDRKALKSYITQTHKEAL
jgi:hypothetical protein